MFNLLKNQVQVWWHCLCGNIRTLYCALGRNGEKPWRWAMNLFLLLLRHVASLWPLHKLATCLSKLHLVVYSKLISNWVKHLYFLLMLSANISYFKNIFLFTVIKSLNPSWGNQTHNVSNHMIDHLKFDVFDPPGIRLTRVLQRLFLMEMVKESWPVLLHEKKGREQDAPFCVSSTCCVRRIFFKTRLVPLLASSVTVLTPPIWCSRKCKRTATPDEFHTAYRDVRRP